MYPISSTNSEILSSSFLIYVPLISFSCLFVLDRTSSAVLSRYGEIGQACLVPGVSRVTLIFSPFSLICDLDLLCIAFIMFRNVYLFIFSGVFLVWDYLLPCFVDVVNLFRWNFPSSTFGRARFVDRCCLDLILSWSNFSPFMVIENFAAYSRLHPTIGLASMVSWVWNISIPSFLAFRVSIENLVVILIGLTFICYLAFPPCSF